MKDRRACRLTAIKARSNAGISLDPTCQMITGWCSSQTEASRRLVKIKAATSLREWQFRKIWRRISAGQSSEKSCQGLLSIVATLGLDGKALDYDVYDRGHETTGNSKSRKVRND